MQTPRSWLCRIKILPVLTAMLAVPASLFSVSMVAASKPVVAKKTPVASSGSNSKFALLVGVTQYNRSGLDDLHGCLNDVDEMKRVLVSAYGFKPENILSLTNAAATRQGIIGGFRKQLRDKAAAYPAGTFLFYYSGHGSHIHDINGDEALENRRDTEDETLCAYDADLVDDDIDVLNRELRATKGFCRSLSEIFDSCHSQSASRGEFDPKAPVIKAPRSGYKSSATPVLRGGSRRIGRSEPGYFAAFSGCLSAQTSAEQEFSLPLPSGSKARVISKWHGVLTYYLLQAMRETGPNTTNSQIWVQVARAISGKYDQLPQLEGDAHRFFLDGRAPGAKAPVTTYTLSGNTLSFPKGFEAGAVRGGYIGVYNGGQLKEQLTISRAELGKATAQVPKGTQLAKRGTVQLLTPYFGSEPLQIRLGPGITAHNPVVQRLARIYKGEKALFVRLAATSSSKTSGAAKAVYLLQDTRGSAQDTSFRVGKDPNEKGYFIADSTGGRSIFGKFFPAKGGGDITDGQEETLCRTLDNYAAQSNFKALANNLPGAVAPEKVVGTKLFEVKGFVDAQENWVTKESSELNLTDRVPMKVGSTVQFELSNRTNQPLNVALIWLSQDGGITVLQTTDRRSNLTLARKGFPGYKVQTFGYNVNPPLGRESIKIFVSKEPIDISYLERPPISATGAERGSKGVASPFDVIAGQAKGTRGPSMAGENLAFESWGIQSLALDIIDK